MAVPTQKEMYRPALEYAKTIGKSFSVPDLTKEMARIFAVSSADREVKLPHGKGKFDKNVEWVNFRMKKARLTQSTAHGLAQITQDGIDVASTSGIDVNAEVDRRIKLGPTGQPVPPDRVRTDTESGSSDEETTVDPVEAWSADAAFTQDVTPDELMSLSYHQLNQKIVDELLNSIGGVSPDRFEQLVVDLLVKMGYGQGEAVGRSGDGGIDGVINQDELGLEKVYVQAKRWANQVGEPEIRNFSGSLDPYGATKGVFITTSTFSSTAQETARTISAGNKFIRLVDGNELAQLMIRHGVGVVTEYTYEIKKLDENYFADEF